MKGSRLNNKERHHISKQTKDTKEMSYNTKLKEQKPEF